MALHDRIWAARGQCGQSTTEFVVILALIAIVAILALIFLGDAIAELMTLVGETVE